MYEHIHILLFIYWLMNTKLQWSSFLFRSSTFNFNKWIRNWCTKWWQRAANELHQLWLIIDSCSKKMYRKWIFNVNFSEKVHLFHLFAKMSDLRCDVIDYSISFIMYCTSLPVASGNSRTREFVILKLNIHSILRRLNFCLFILIIVDVRYFLLFLPARTRINYSRWFCNAWAVHIQLSMWEARILYI